jgi:UDP-GlcNAc:undecaprenyl-phosphate GlcNAc-1-phosphate transferase
MQWWQVYLGVGLTAAAVSLVCTLLCRQLAPHLGFMDRPLHEEHKRHSDATPVLGGIAMLAAWILTILGGLIVSQTCKAILSPNLGMYLPGIQTKMPQLLCIVIGATALVFLGLADDRWRLRADAKFAGQFCVAGAVACWGVRITAFCSEPVITWSLTTFWILLVVNAINFFDNMDGLAAGTAAIAAALFALVAGMRGQHFVAVLATATAGVAFGFLLLNRPPASIFMGDSGSHFLGYALAITGALTTFYTPDADLSRARILIPLLVLGLPLFDACAVVFIRLREKRPIYVGDHCHISHRFTDLGLSRGQAVLLVHLLTFSIGAGGVSLYWLPRWGAALIILQSLATLAVVSLLQLYGRRKQEERT